MSRFLNKSIIIACHELLEIGPAQDLRDFLLKKGIGNLLYITHPLLTDNELSVSSSKSVFYKNGRLLNRRQAFSWILPEPILYIKDFIYTVFWTYSFSNKYDIFFGNDPLNALAGIILKKLGKVEMIIHCSIDYFPRRFNNSLMNKIYYMIDHFCVKYSDETWNVSPNMAVSREKKYRDKKLKTKQTTVPIGVWFNQIHRKNFEKINKKKIVYIGLLSKATGVELIVRALPKIIKKIPDVRLEILGGGPEEVFLRNLSKKMKLESYIKFYSWVNDKKLKFKLMADAAVGLVLFDKKLFKEEIQNADPMKIKDYMVLGMPIISTDVISTAAIIGKARAGIIIRYDEDELAGAVIKILGDEKLLKEYRENAVNYIRQFDFEIIYGKNLQRLLLSETR